LRPCYPGVRRSVHSRVQFSMREKRTRDCARRGTRCGRADRVHCASCGHAELDPVASFVRAVQRTLPPPIETDRCALLPLHRWIVEALVEAVVGTAGSAVKRGPRGSFAPIGAPPTSTTCTPFQRVRHIKGASASRKTRFECVLRTLLD